MKQLLITIAAVVLVAVSKKLNEAIRLILNDKKKVQRMWNAN